MLEPGTLYACFRWSGYRVQQLPRHGADIVEKADGGFGLSRRGSLNGVGKGTPICAVLFRFGNLFLPLSPRALD